MKYPKKNLLYNFFILKKLHHAFDFNALTQTGDIELRLTEVKHSMAPVGTVVK